MAIACTRDLKWAMVSLSKEPAIRNRMKSCYFREECDGMCTNRASKLCRIKSFEFPVGLSVPNMCKLASCKNL